MFYLWLYDLMQVNSWDGVIVSMDTTMIHACGSNNSYELRLRWLGK